MKRILTALVLIPAVLALLLYAPHWVFACVVGLVALLAADEFLLLAKAHGLQPFRKTTLLFIALYFAGLATRDFEGIKGVVAKTGFPDSDVLMYAIVVRIFPLLLLIMAMARENLRTSLPGAGASYLAVPYIGLTLGQLVTVHHTRFGIVWLLVFLAVIWSGDILAYYVGRAIGRHPLAPRISPKKTWEGAVASLVGAVGAGVLFSQSLTPIVNLLIQMGIYTSTSLMPETVHREGPPILSVIVFSVLINVAAQLGDLVESMIKRGADVKDSGSLLPGHGGILDRIDAMLLAAPVLWYYATAATQISQN